MLGQPISMLLPQVLGFRLEGELPEGSTATDLVLTVTEMLRERGVVGKFVEFFGPGLPHTRPGRPGDDREHVAGVRLHLRDLPRGRGDAPLSRVHGPANRADRAGRRLRPRAGHVSHRGLRGADFLRRRSSSTSRRSARPSPGRSARRTGSRSPTPRVGFLESLREFDPDAAEELGNHHDEAVEESFPASDPPADDHDDDRGKPRHVVGDVAAAIAEARADDVVDGHAGGRDRGRARPRMRGDRRDHQLHQHVESVGDARRRAAGQEGGRARARLEALGEDLAGARARRSLPTTSSRLGSTSRSTSSGSTSSATAARPASATPARCRRRSRRR